MALPSVESLESLRGLQRDLLNLSETTIHNVDQLHAELVAHLEDFRTLMRKKPRNEKSRQSLSSDKVKLRDDEYALNEDFRQQTIELSDALDLDELESASLLQDAQQALEDLDRPAIITAIITFHQIRQYSFQCLRLALDRVTDPQLGEDVSPLFNVFLSLLLQDGGGKTISMSTYWTQCLDAMNEIEQWSERVNERIQRVTVTEQTQTPEFIEVMEFQRHSLSQQHEELGVIAYRLGSRGQVGAEPLRGFLQKLRTVERYDVTVVHKLPALFVSMSHLASSENTCALEEAKSLHQIITTKKENEIWALPNLQAAVSLVWIAEYSARSSERTGATTHGGHNASEPDVYESCFNQSLKNGALQFLLALSHDVKPKEWYDPAKQGFHSFLIQDTPALQIDPFSAQEPLQDSVMDCLQDFAESLITNLPDALRKLKLEEDEQRRQLQGRLHLRPNEFELHLERFLLLISNAYGGYIDASDRFWSGVDSNLYGFLQWASQRQSTPRVAAFCEVLQSLSGDESSADHAHEFLLDDTAAGSSRPRRNSPLSWNHIFRELEYYSSTIRDKPASQVAGSIAARSHPDMTVEPESAVMLECYLRLIAHLSAYSPTARDWLLNGQFDVLGNLLLLCASNIPSRLRACAFTALSGLLTNKTVTTRNSLWSAIDAWIFAQPSALLPQATRPLQLSSASASADRVILDKILLGFEEPNAFVRLIISLIAPVPKGIPIKDVLPFPEELGTKYRMSGIESYVDFVLGSVLGPKSEELSDPLQLQIMRWNCLGFAASCLSDFNEELIILANKTNIAIESAIETSSLTIYVRMHPFARTMEWLFNERVVAALFGAAVQDVDEVNSSSPESPLLLSLLRSVEVITLVLTLQRTYFDIVRPIIKTQSNDRRTVVANAAFASFEDAVVGRLDLITSLCLYSSSGHADLAVSSLQVLRKLSESRKLSLPIRRGSTRTTEKGRLIVALEKDYEAARISRALASIMQFDERELGADPVSPGIVIKSKILDFIASSLDSVKDASTVAHLLLGFACSPYTVFVNSSSLFGTPNSLFDSVMAFSSIIPDTNPVGDSYSSLLIDLRNKALHILRRLWRSPMSTQLVLPELRSQDYVFSQIIRFSVIAVDTLWDYNAIRDPGFWTSGSALGYANFLRTRSALFELAATELRAAHETKASTLQSRLLSSLLGSTTLLNGQTFTNATIFDVLDFVDLGDRPSLTFPATQYFSLSMFNSCKDGGDEPFVTHDMDGVEQILLLRQSELQKSQKLRYMTDIDRQKLHEEVELVKAYFIAENAKIAVMQARLDTIKAWTNLATIMVIVIPPFEGQQRSLITQLLQLILPKLERAFNEDISTAEIFANFSLTLVRCGSFDAESRVEDSMTDDAQDRLFDLFRTALVGAQCPDGTSFLRRTCSQTCRTFICNVCVCHRKFVRRTLQTCKFLGDRLIEMLCEDAAGGDVASRTSSTLLLEAIAYASNLGGSKWFVDALNRINFLQITMKFIGSLASELQQTDHNDISSEFAYIGATFTFLARVAQSRHGGNSVLYAGFFSAVQDSGVFSADPDIGLDVDDPQALSRFYGLMLAILRVVNAVVLSQGTQNDQAIYHARQFLHEHRHTMASIFKKNAGIGSSGPENHEVLNELVDNYTALIVAADFMESPEEKLVKAATPRIFT